MYVPLVGPSTLTPNWITSPDLSSVGLLSSPVGLSLRSFTNVPLLLFVSWIKNYKNMQGALNGINLFRRHSWSYNVLRSKTTLLSWNQIKAWFLESTRQSKIKLFAWIFVFANDLPTLAGSFRTHSLWANGWDFPWGINTALATSTVTDIVPNTVNHIDYAHVICIAQCSRTWVAKTIGGNGEFCMLTKNNAVAGCEVIHVIANGIVILSNWNHRSLTCMVKDLCWNRYFA